jgi:hypothetical protein
MAIPRPVSAIDKGSMVEVLFVGSGDKTIRRGAGSEFVEKSVARLT